MGAPCRDRAVALCVGLLAARCAARDARSGRRARLPLRRGRRALHPGDHDRPGRARVHLAARPRVGSTARLPSHGRRAGAPLRRRREGGRRQRDVPRRSRPRSRSFGCRGASARARSGDRVQPGDLGGGRRWRRRRSRPRAVHVDPSRVLGTGLHARGARADRRAPFVASRRARASRWTAASTARPRAPRATPERISSWPGARSSGPTTPALPTATWWRSSVPEPSLRGRRILAALVATLPEVALA